MERVIITGAASMIGAALAEECLKNHVEVLALVRKASAHRDRLPQSDLLTVRDCGLEELASLTDVEGYDVFYHLAWGHTAKESRDNPVLQEKNIRYTLDAVELARRAGCRCFIGAGSQAEYGPVEGIISPDTKVHPQIAYGIAKYAAGKLSRKLCDSYRMTHVWARVFSVYGRNDNADTMLDYAIKQFIKGEAAYFSAAAQPWDYLHERDAGKIFYLLGEKCEASKIYCVASGESRPLKEFIKELQDAFGEGAECKFAESEAGGSVYGLQADVAELVQDIRYKPQVSFAEGIADMIAHKRGEYDEEGKPVDSYVQ